MAKKKRTKQAKGYKPPSISEIFEPLSSGWQNIGDSLVWDPNAAEDFGKMMTVKDAKKFRKEYSDQSDAAGSGKLDNKFKEHIIEEEEIPGAVVDPNDPNYNLGDPAEGGNFEPVLNDEDVDNYGDGARVNAESDAQLAQSIAKQTLEHNNTKYLKSVAWDGSNKMYTTDYKEAVKNAAGWSQFYDDADDPDNPMRRSDVFTRAERDWGMYKEGDILGVMGRSQRKAYDTAMHEARMATRAQMEDAGRSESDVKAINSKEGLETIITGGESSTKKVAGQSKGETSFKSSTDKDKNK